jgi:hypothetical protein
MDRPSYGFEYSPAHKLYSFISEGDKGDIIKLVQFQFVDDDTFNLAFGDWNEALDGIDDMVVTDNGDMEKVLATIIQIIKKFLSSNHRSSVQFTGSTPVRTRLYQIIISINYESISQQFEVWGYLNGIWHRFEKNVNYEVFLISELL